MAFRPTVGALRLGARWQSIVVAAILLAVLAAPARAAVPVNATVETEPELHAGDAADDSAIWIHPTDPSLSTVIGTDKTSPLGGLDVFDLSGRRLYFYADARMNNVDVRYNFPLGATQVSLVGVTNRSAQTLDFYKVNVGDRSLSKIGNVKVRSDMATARGFALYHSPVSGKYYAFVTDSGKTDQFELSGASGQVTGAFVRRLASLGVTEGLVADDGLGRIYVAEEDIGGVWRFGAEPGDPLSGTKVVATTESGGPIVQDIKGITIYYGRGSGGYLIAASQGADDFHLLTRTDNAYLGAFRIAAGNGIDAVTNIDGIDVTNFGLGASFPQGMFVSHDDVNDGANQNHKLVPWQAIANAFSPALLIDPLFDPRQVGAPNNGYVRPQAGAQLRVPLTIAYARCGDNETPNRSHSGGLSGGSCNPAQQLSTHLTVGTTDANGFTAQSGGFVKLTVCPSGTTASGACSTPAGMTAPDVRIEANVTDVRCKAGVSTCQGGVNSDYTGELQVRPVVRITDKHNSTTSGGTGDQATVADGSYLPVTVLCAPNAGGADASAIGGTCSVLTRANAVVPGALVAGKRGNWELRDIRVFDGGADGDVDTAGNALFQRQGIFVP